MHDKNGYEDLTKIITINRYKEYIIRYSIYLNILYCTITIKIDKADISIYIVKNNKGIIFKTYILNDNSITKIQQYKKNLLNIIKLNNINYYKYYYIKNIYNI